MFTVELYAGIRRAVMVDGLSRREAAKRFGVHRNTITKMLQFSVPPGYRRRERPTSKKLGPFMAWIDKVLKTVRLGPQALRPRRRWRRGRAGCHRSISELWQLRQAKHHGFRASSPV